MTRILVFILAILPWPAIAQEVFPALYDVAGVAADDVLNVRAEPSAGSEITGTLMPFETGVEVIRLSEDGRWGRVNAGEQAGWAAMRFLAREPGQTAADWAGGLAPMPLDCFGTEPFWGLSLATDGSFEFTDPFHGDGVPMTGSFVALAASASMGKHGFFGMVNGYPSWLSGIVSFEICSDGMSDQDYGLALDLARGDPTGGRLAAGCCRLAR